MSNQLTPVVNDLERLGLPSASKFSLTANCPGSEALIRSIGAQEDAPDEMALRGLRIHKAWESGDVSDLYEDERDDYERTMVLENQSREKWMADHGLNGYQSFKEKRLWYHDPTTLEPRASGKFDDLLIAQHHAFVRDLKSGWCQKLTRSEQNWQLRLLAVLVWIEYGQKYNLKTIRVAFIKPKFFREAIDSCEYTDYHLKMASTLIDAALWESSQPDAQRRPGGHCDRCPVKAHCPEAAAYSLVPSLQNTGGIRRPYHSPISVESTKADIASLVSGMTIQDLASVHRRASVVNKVLEAVKARLKSLPPEELAAVGLKVGEGKNLSPITKTREAFNILITQGGGNLWSDELWSSLNFKKTELIEAYRRSHPGLSQKESEEYILNLLSSCIESKTTEGSLEEI